jgi:hypothetical protein
MLQGVIGYAMALLPGLFKTVRAIVATRSTPKRQTGSLNHPHQIQD